MIMSFTKIFQRPGIIFCTWENSEKISRKSVFFSKIERKKFSEQANKFSF